MARAIIFRQRWEQLAEAAHFNARELARLCQLSSRQLQRDFRRCFGRSPQDWLDERRILAAQRLLLTGLPVKVVAYELGFKQPSHFCRQFKSTSRVTPTEYVLLQMQTGQGCRSRITNSAGR